MKNFVRLNITDNNILDEVSFFVKCHVDFIWLVIPDDFSKSHLIDDIISICEGETAVWIDSNQTFDNHFITGVIKYGLPKDSSHVWAGVAKNLADFKNMELAGAQFVLIEYFDVFGQSKDGILGDEGLHTIFEDESYGWSILTINTPVYVYGKLNKAQTIKLHESTFVEGYEIN
ncbi:MAG: hypothetical protein MK078_11180 [Crocinitomicaceae bacterium]|nr:hypothetical protein [Crocinitomicaceae bacterium]